MRIKCHGSVERFADGVVHTIPSVALILNYSKDYTLTVDVAFAKWNATGSVVVKKDA